MKARGAAAVAVVVLTVVLGIWWWLGGERASSSEARVIEAGSPTGGTPGLPEPRAAMVPSLPAEAPPTSRPEQSEPQDLLLTSLGTRRVLSGWLLDRRGEPLGRHVLRISTSGGPGATQREQFEVEVTTERDGRFVIDGISAGTKLIKVSGPDAGDLLVARPDPRHPERDPIQPMGAEGALYMKVEPDGLHDVTLVAPGHAAFWVDGALEFEPWARHWVGAGETTVYLQDPQQPVGERPPPLDRLAEIRAMAIGPVAVVDKDEWFPRPASAFAFVVPAYSVGDTLLVVRSYGYATLTRPVSGSLLREHVGVLNLERVAGLEIVALESSLQAPMVEGEVFVREWGGSLPERLTRLEFGEHSLVFWSERRTGQYELRIACSGYAEWTGSGDLVIAPDELPVVTAELHRSR